MKIAGVRGLESNFHSGRGIFQDQDFSDVAVLEYERHEARDFLQTLPQEHQQLLLNADTSN